MANSANKKQLYTLHFRLFRKNTKRITIATRFPPCQETSAQKRVSCAEVEGCEVQILHACHGPSLRIRNKQRSTSTGNHDEAHLYSSEMLGDCYEHVYQSIICSILSNSFSLNFSLFQLDSCMPGPGVSFALHLVVQVSSRSSAPGRWWRSIDAKQAFGMHEQVHSAVGAHTSLLPLELYINKARGATQFPWTNLDNSHFIPLTPSFAFQGSLHH